MKKNDLILSVHIPKCGGTTFRSILNKIYAPDIFFEYSQESDQIVNAKNISENVKCIHGHLIYKAYKQLIHSSNLITFLRHPVYRTISFYEHIKRIPSDAGTLSQFFNSSNPSLIEFAEHPIARNYGLGFTGNLNPDDFLFIGFLEEFESSIKNCSKALNWQVIPSYEIKNKGNLKEDILTKNQYEYIKDLNKEELNWYNHAKSKFLNFN
jgi:hypothetical protein